MTNKSSMKISMSHSIRCSSTTSIERERDAEKLRSFGFSRLKLSTYVLFALITSDWMRLTSDVDDDSHIIESMCLFTLLDVFLRGKDDIIIRTIAGKTTLNTNTSVIRFSPHDKKTLPSRLDFLVFSLNIVKLSFPSSERLIESNQSFLHSIILPIEVRHHRTRRSVGVD